MERGKEVDEEEREGGPDGTAEPRAGERESASERADGRALRKEGRRGEGVTYVGEEPSCVLGRGWG